MDFKGLNIPESMKGDVEKHSGFLKRQMFQFMTKSLEGKVIFKHKSFKDAQGITEFLNDNRLGVIFHAILPDFNTCTYTVIYEEENNG